MYDASSYTPARYLLLKREAATSPPPGSPYRWKLGADTQPLADLDLVFRQAENLYNIWVRVHAGLGCKLL